MEFDAEIDSELIALSDLTIDETDSYQSDDDENEDIPENVPTVDYDPTHVDWMKLFLDRTKEQANNIETSLNDAKIVLQEIDKNVNECHSRALSVLDEQDSAISENFGVGEAISEERVVNEDRLSSCDNDTKSELMLVSENTMSLIEAETPEHDFKLENDERIIEFEALCEKEILHRIDDIEAKRLASEKHLQELEDAERKILFELDQQKQFYENERINNAACLIQSLYRRYLVRNEYGAIIDERLINLKQRRAEERLRLIEEKRKEEKALKVEKGAENTVFQTEIDEETSESDLLSASTSLNELDKADIGEKLDPKLSDQLPTTARAHHLTTVHQTVKSSEDSQESELEDVKSFGITTEVSVEGQLSFTSSDSTTKSRDLEGAFDRNSIEILLQKSVKTSSSIENIQNTPREFHENEALSQKDFLQNKVLSDSTVDKEALIQGKDMHLMNERSCEDKMKQNVSFENIPKASRLGQSEKELSQAQINTPSVSPEEIIGTVNLDDKPVFSSETATVSKLNRDLDLLEKSVFLDSVKKDNDIISAVSSLSSEAHNSESINQTPRTAKSLLQAIDDDLTQLKSSVVLSSENEMSKIAGTPYTNCGLESKLEDSSKHEKEACITLSPKPIVPISDQKFNDGQLTSPQAITESVAASRINSNSSQENLKPNDENTSPTFTSITKSVTIAESFPSKSLELSAGKNSEVHISNTTTDRDLTAPSSNPSDTTKVCKSTVTEVNQHFKDKSDDSCVQSVPSKTKTLKSTSGNTEPISTHSSVPTARSLFPTTNFPKKISSSMPIKDDCEIFNSSLNKDEPIEDDYEISNSSSNKDEPIKDDCEISNSSLNKDEPITDDCEIFNSSSNKDEPIKDDCEIFNSSSNKDEPIKDETNSQVCKTSSSFSISSKTYSEKASNELFSKQDTFELASNLGNAKANVEPNSLAEEDVQERNRVQKKKEIASTVDFSEENKKIVSENASQENFTFTNNVLVKNPEQKKDVVASNENFETEKTLLVLDSTPSQSEICDNHKKAVENPLQSLPPEQSSALWKKWQKQCIAWDMNSTKNVSKPHLKRAIRKSSAAKKLPPLSEEDILRGKWPYLQDLATDHTLETLSRVYIGASESTRGHNLINIHRCTNLTHLTLIKCGLISLEGLQACPSLRHIDASNNNVSVISCDNMKRLDSLVVRNNRLTSIHGLSGCHSLLLLEVSNNNITKLAGLEDCHNLAHLRLSSNQLMQVTGLKSLKSLISLDVSSNNLSSLDGIEHCGLLRSLDASGNCFSKIPVDNLVNLILLVNLNLSENSIESLDVTLDNADQFLFLPLLTYLQLQQNKISFEEGLGVHPISNCAPLLLELNLTQNLISNVDVLMKFLTPLKNLKRLFLIENLLSSQQEEQVLEYCRERDFEVFFQDDVIMTSPSKTALAINQVLTLPPTPNIRELSPKKCHDLYLNMTGKQRREYFDLVQSETKELKNLRGWRKTADESSTHSSPPDLFSYHCDYLQKHTEMAAQQRLIQEGRHSYVEKSILSSNDQSEVEKSFNRTKQSSNSPSADPNLDEKKQLWAQNDSKAFDGHGPTDEAFSSSSRLKPCQQSKLDSFSHSNLQSTHDTSFSSQSPKYFSRHGKHENSAASKIQISWRKYAARKKRRTQACTRIQAVWRGYIVRSKMQKAFQSFNTSSDIDINEFEEVDLSQLEFDENVYDQQWAIRTNIRPPPNTPPPSTPAHRSHSAGLGRRSPYSPKKFSAQVMDDTALQKPYNEVDDGQNLWQKIASFSKPPLPPITPTGSTVTTEQYDLASVGDGINSDLDSHRSKYSRKEEVLANEWGLHNSSAVELMLKRAKRMKGRKKKQVNADEKLRRFQDIKQRVSEKPLLTARKPTQPQHRMEYFKAREFEFESREEKPSEDDERRRQYTYEWLHTSANVSSSKVHQPPPHGHYSSPRIPAKWRQSDSGSTKSGFLPTIPQHRSAGSPLQQNDLEIASVSSQNTQHTRNKNLLRDIARRHGESPRPGPFGLRSHYHLCLLRGGVFTPTLDAGCQAVQL